MQGSSSVRFVIATAGVLSVLRLMSTHPACAQQVSAPVIAQQATLHGIEPAESTSYRQLQSHLAHGWNTWDVHSVTTFVSLPDGLAIRVGMKQNTTVWGDQFLQDALIGRLEPGAEQVTPGPHAWDGSYTDLRVDWKSHSWRIQSAHADAGLVVLATPLESKTKDALPTTIVFSVGYLWNRPGTAERSGETIQARSPSRTSAIYCTCTKPGEEEVKTDVPVSGPYFAAGFHSRVGLSAGKPRSLSEIEAVIDHAQKSYQASIDAAGQTAPTLDAIETTLGWDTIYEPEKQRVISPVSRVWCVNWGGYVLFDWDTFFAATLAAVGDKELAYANAIEILHEETPQGFVPNYARAGNWKSFDRSEPPVGAITVLGLYQRFHDRWFLLETYEPLLKWNRWWNEHRTIDGYLAWGSDGDTNPANLDDNSRGTLQGAIYESGLDNSPMYDHAGYDTHSHLMEVGDVGLMSLYIADCDALATIAAELGKANDAEELRSRSAKVRARLTTLWDEKSGMFLNKDLRDGSLGHRLSPTNFYPLLAHAATDAQAKRMIDEHLLNPREFWGEWTMPSIGRDDPAFTDQNYWRGRIWGPMNYLVYLGLQNYEVPDVRKQFAERSYALFSKEWNEKGHVHENYNAILGTGDDVANSDRFYHWGALLGYAYYLEERSLK